MSEAPTDLSPSLLERLFLLVDSMGAGNLIFWVLDIDGRLEEAALAATMERAIREEPRLDSLVRLSAFRCTRIPYGVPSGAAAPPILERCPGVSHPDDLPPIGLDLTRQRPVKAFLLDGPADRTRLMVVFCHSATDAQGATHFVRRWGEHYLAATTGAPLPPRRPDRPRPGYRWLLREMTPIERLKAWAIALDGFREIVGVYIHPSPRRCATIEDNPSGGPERLRHHLVRIDFHLFRRLMQWAVAEKASLADGLILATATAAGALWPPSDGSPFRISLPVDQRDSEDRDAANRITAIDINLEPDLLKGAALAMERIKQRTAAARGRKAAVRRLMQHVIVAHLPPFLARPLIRRFFEKRENTFETFNITMLDLLQAPVPTFGGQDVVDGYLCGNVYPRPAIRFNVCAGRQGLALCISHDDGVIRADRVAVLGRHIVEVLRSLTEGRG